MLYKYRFRLLYYLLGSFLLLFYDNTVLCFFFVLRFKMHANNDDLDISAKFDYYDMLTPHLTRKHEAHAVVSIIEKIVRLWDYDVSTFFRLLQKISLNCEGKKNVFVTCKCTKDTHLKLCKYSKYMLRSEEHYVFNFDNTEKLEMVFSSGPDNIRLNHIVFSILSVVANNSLDRRGLDHSLALRVQEFWPVVEQEAATSHKRPAEHSAEENVESKRLAEPTPPNSIEYNQDTSVLEECAHVDLDSKRLAEPSPPNTIEYNPDASVLEEWAHVDLDSSRSDSHTLSDFLNGLERECSVDIQTPSPAPAPQEEIDVFNLLNTQPSSKGSLEVSTPFVSESDSYAQLLEAQRNLQSKYKLLESNFKYVSNKYDVLVEFSAHVVNENTRLNTFLHSRLPDDEELLAAIQRLQPK